MEILNKKSLPKPVVLMILDGLGIADPNKGNAVTLAKTPNLNMLWPKYDHCYLQASGNYVGLPTGVTGNSEVGHMSLGAGRIVYQEIAKIDKDIESGAFMQNEVMHEALTHAKENKSKIHFIGVLSDGRVHASLDHLFACLEFCSKNNFPGDKVFVHAFTDGRDTPPQNAAEFFQKLDLVTKKLKTGKLASIIGRYYAMDRDDRWDRTKLAYDLIVHGKGTPSESWEEALKGSYSKGVFDEYIEPHILIKKNSPIALVEDGDVVIFYNYRGDRAVQLSKAFDSTNFYNFPAKKFNNLYFAGFSNYEKGMVMNREQFDVEDAGGESQMVKKLFNQELNKTQIFPKRQVFPPASVENSFGHLIAESGLSQLRLAESEKFPHVTYFFSCRLKDPFDREDRIEVPSPREVKTYDQKPEMSSYEITKELLKAIKSNKYDFILVNYALTDMVAHTGNLQASIKAVEVADECVGTAVREIQMAGGEVLITADHGNIEELINLITGERDTKHSINPVPAIYVSKDTATGKDLQMGMLADVAPSLLQALDISIPESMTGRQLF